jgi:hypothetical protein
VTSNRNSDFNNSKNRFERFVFRRPTSPWPGVDEPGSSTIDVTTAFASFAGFLGTSTGQFGIAAGNGDDLGSGRAQSHLPAGTRDSNRTQAITAQIRMNSLIP